MYEVCVWEMPFPPEGFELDSTGSPNVYFTTECSGNIGITGYNQSELSIYPNPAKDLLTIETKGSGLYTIEIISLNGQLFYHHFIEGPILQSTSGGRYWIRTSILILRRYIPGGGVDSCISISQAPFQPR